jgi:glycosyltransferase involved in cell wall biosynthesis
MKNTVTHAQTRNATPWLSVVVPMLNERDNVVPLVEAVRSALVGSPDWELILVDDGSTDGTLEVARDEVAADGRVVIVELARRYGQSTAMQAGFDHARGRVVVTMDGDLQNDARDIPVLVAELDKGYDVVAGYRERRQDRLWTRRFPSRVANWIIGRVTGQPIRDSGCTLKAYRRELLARMRLYSEMHRFIPAMAMGVAGARVTELPVRHHPRVHGRSKYGLFRIVQVVIDLLTITMIRTFRFRPFTMYARMAAFWALVGSVCGVVALVASFGTQQAGNLLVWHGVALLFLALSLYLLMLGLIGEVALRTQRDQIMRHSPLVHEMKRR